MASGEVSMEALMDYEVEACLACVSTKERQQSLTYVCETPVILEQRAFALSRAIAGRLD